MTTLILLIFLLTIKHFVVDYPLQGPYQYLNKGTYGHLGGILHACYHGVGTMFVLVIIAHGAKISNEVIASICLIDIVVHYHIDWAKVQINKKMGWGPTTHEQFWVLLGVDQFLHSVTYLSFAAYLIPYFK